MNGVEGKGVTIYFEKAGTEEWYSKVIFKDEGYCLKLTR